MSDEPKVGESEAKAEVAAQAEIDYKAELERVQKEKAENERRLAQAEFTIKRLKQKKEEHVEPDIAEEAPAADDIEEIVSRKVEQVRADLTVNVVEEELGKIAQNPDLAALVRHHYEGSIVKTGATRAAIAEDLRKALAIANAKVIAKVGAESAHAAASAAATSSGYAGGQRTDRSGDELTESERADVAAIARRTGIAVDKVTQTYLANRRNAR